MAQETEQFSKHEKLDLLLQDLFRKAFKVNAKYPLHFAAEEIYKMSGKLEDKEKMQLSKTRKIVSRLQALFEHLRNRDSTSTSNADNEEPYFKKHDLKKHRIELIAIAYMSRKEGENPLERIADYISHQADYTFLAKKELEELEAKQKIYTKLVQQLINEKPMNLDEIKDFSTKIVSDEFGKKM